MILEEFIVDYRDIEILYEDNHLLVVTKPRNMLSQGDVTGDMDIHTLMKRYIKEKYNKPGNVYLGLVHRLDRPVGGVMVFAKTSKCASRLSAQMREDKFSKGYLAVIEGIPSNTRGELFHYLLKDRRKNVTKVVKEGTKDAKPALLRYNVLGHKNGLSLVDINLVTGRAHQIRVQFSNEGYPIYGDQRYGKNSKESEQIALWAYKLGFYHPTKKEYIEFKAEPPEEYPWDIFQKRL